MRVAFIGLGKLGLPVAVAAAMRGHDVVGYDRDPSRMSYEPQGYIEAGPDGTGDFDDWLAACAPDWRRDDRPDLIAGSLVFAPTLAEAIAGAEIIFVAVQTPHEPQFEGITPLPEERADFDYRHLVAACMEIAEHVRTAQTVAIISTVLPGTTRREIYPVLEGRCRIAYNPSFIAMSTTMRDYIDCEFVLIGSDDVIARELLASYYSRIAWAPVQFMSIESAELAKVGYNAAIGAKIAIANTMMEICHKTPGADVDAVTGAMKAAHRRLASPAYMDAGAGDGGACHPRDNIAMSWLAREIDLSHNLFDDIMRCREDQARWLAWLLREESESRDLPIAIYGYSYKPGVAITTGSSALLVANLVSEMGPGPMPELLDRIIEPDRLPDRPMVYLVGCRHPGVEEVRWPEGSVVVDPFRCVPDQNGVVVHRIGEGWARATTSANEKRISP